jgi:hypothetical protein
MKPLTAGTHTWLSAPAAARWCDAEHETHGKPSRYTASVAPMSNRALVAVGTVRKTLHSSGRAAWQGRQTHLPGGRRGFLASRPAKTGGGSRNRRAALPRGVDRSICEATVRNRTWLAELMSKSRRP